MEKISVITICFNAAECIEATILSVISQDYPNVEYIIKDGRSSDDTMNIVNRYKSNIQKITSSSDKGIFDAMNEALKLATGDWVVFMNAGDMFSNSSVLSRVFIDQIYDKKVGFIWGYTQFVRNGILIEDHPVPFYDCKLSVKPMGFCHQSVFVRTKLALFYNFDLEYRVAADYNMIKNIHSTGNEPVKVEFCISIVDMDGFSANNRYLQFLEIGKICGVDNRLSYKIQKIICCVKQICLKMYKYSK